MPIITDVDREHSQVRSVAVGRVTYEDVRDHLSLERRFEALPYPELIDVRGSVIVFTKPRFSRLLSYFEAKAEKHALDALPF